MKILGLPILDIAVIFVYFAVVVWIGIRAMKNIKNTEDYFLGGRKFGKAISTFAAFGQATSADSAVTTTTFVSTNGAAGIGMGLINGVAAMPILWMTTMWYRRMRYTSLAEYFEERFGSKKMAGFYALAQTVMFMLVAAVGFVAMSKTIVAIAEKPESALTQVELEERNLALELKTLQDRDFQLLDASERERLEFLSKENPKRSFSYLKQNYLTIGIACLILFCAVIGGLEGAFITEVIQGSFIIILTLMLIPFAMIRINNEYDKTGFMGTFEAFHENLPEAFFKILGSPNVPNFTWYYILAFGVLAALNIAVQANQLTSAGSAKDDETARMGFVTGIFIKRYCYVIWGFVAMMTMLLFSAEVSDADYVWGLATRQLLPSGLVGLMIACLMAALMSTVVALMLTSSALVTNSIYKPLFPGKTEGHYVFAGRIFCGIYFIGAIWVTLSMDDILTLFIFMTGFNSIIAATFWIGMTWRRATKAAAWTSISVTFIFTLALPLLIPLLSGARDNPDLLKYTNGYTVSNTYTAKQVDLDERNTAIEVWDKLDE
ncbi:MAG: sodium:solute symporter family protein, partial [Verrucomicrobiota bacterium]